MNTLAKHGSNSRNDYQLVAKNETNEGGTDLVFQSPRAFVAIRYDSEGDEIHYARVSRVA